jgi:hypothetical protein
MGGLFTDNLRASTRMFKNRGAPAGMQVILTCPECGRQPKINFSWEEVHGLLNNKPAIVHLPDGRSVPMTNDGNGWRGFTPCAPACVTGGNRDRTVVEYRVFHDDLARHWNNYVSYMKQQGR